jgi:hypothetical protein
MKKIGLVGILLAATVGLVLLVAACQGPVGTQGPAGPQGAVGPAGAIGPLSPGTDRGINVTVAMSKPANGTFLTAGEKATVTVTLKDGVGGTYSRDDFATLNLYMDGPQDPLKTVSAVKLLNATTDRTKTPHHYVDLLKDANAKVQGNVITYALQAVSDEASGTYIVGVNSVLKANGLDQQFPVVEVQVGTATAEKQDVEPANCAPCHLGTDSGKYYMHHIDPSSRSPIGSPAIDSAPVRTCKICHNNDGYAAYTPAGGTATPDTIVHRVHGVHMGAELTNPIDTDPTTGVFASYTDVEFPADVLNCTVCHADDRWKTKPSRAACGACHDNTWFGDVGGMPKTAVAHKGGVQADDKACAICHGADTGVAPISKVHDASVNTEHDDAVLTMSAPANGKFFVAGEKPVVTIVIKDSTGKPIDHTKIDTLEATANLQVYGPRAHAQPVLTTASKLGVTNSVASTASAVAASGTPKAWTFAAGDTFKIAVNGGAAQVLTAPTGAQTPDQVASWLQSSLTGVTVTSSATAGTVTIASTVKGSGSRLEIYNSPVTTKMGWKAAGLDITKDGTVIGHTTGVSVEPYVVVANLSTVTNTLRGTADPAVTRTADKIAYQLDDVKGLTPGTYMAEVYTNVAGVVTKNGWARAAFGIVTFQVGTATPEPKVAENCTQCHGNTVMHLNEAHVHPGLFDTDYCLACHDYGRTGTGDLFNTTGGNSTSGWAGFGAKPISARVHGVHFGNYLNYPENVYGGDPSKFTGLIFPQDVRNCTVCHDAKTSGTWKTQPSRLACSACHDSDASVSHMNLMTQNPNPADPYDPKRVETCVVCHGPTAEFSVTNVHNISNPYVPPYPREGFTIS